MTTAIDSVAVTPDDAPPSPVAVPAAAQVPAPNPTTAPGASLIGLRDRAQAAQAAGRLSEALDLHRQALRLAPQAAGIWMSAARLADAMGNQEMSLPLFEEAVRLDPRLLAAVESARRLCVGMGFYDKALHYSRLAAQIQPSDDMSLALALTLPSIQDSLDALRFNRSRYERGLDEALRSGYRVADPFAALGMGAFYLAYHGMNDRELQEKAARLMLQAMPSYEAAHCRAKSRRPGKIRIGIISRFLHGHSIGKTTRGLVEQLDRDRFDVTALRITPSPVDATTAYIERAADRLIALPPELGPAREAIAALELDVLFYQDIGMEPMSYLLALSRLAPVQCVSYGHPNTTGIPSMDYFISNDLYESPGSAEHYSERLVMLEGLPTLAYYHRPPPAERPTRAEFALSDAQHVYLCAQTLFKVHPDFDALIRAILMRDPLGILVFIEGQYADFTTALRQRFAHTLGDAADRVRFLPRMPFLTFLRLLAVADVSLDTPHFNGMNSSLEALAMGTPVVTLPGALQRGRHTRAMYLKMGVTDCIAGSAQEYIDIAVRLGTDRAFAEAIRASIRATCGVLFEDRRVVEQFERFFECSTREAWARSGAGTVIPAAPPLLR